MNNIDREIVSLWKRLTEREKKEVLRQLHEKLSPRCQIKENERAIICMVM